MEEITNKLTLTYIGNIDSKAYFNVEYINGFTDDTVIKVADTCCELKSEFFKNVANYNDNTIRTLTIFEADQKVVTDYNIELYESETLIEKQVVSTDPTDVPALIKENVHVQSIGDRIIEILFDEPVQNLEANFNFAASYLNNKPLALTNEGNVILFDGTNYFTNTGTLDNPVLFSVDATGAEVSLAGAPSQTLTAVYANINAIKAINIPFPLTPATKTLTNLPKAITNSQDCYIIYSHEYSKDPDGDSSVLLNYYFRYYGTDDEGTLYEPADKPIDWLGYFAGKDTTTKVSKDKRKVEIQFDSYSLPTASLAAGDVPHQLIINYAKTFPNYPGSYRILDANKNPFPIVREAVEVKKLANKAVVTSIVALSKDEVLVSFDKPVLCQEYEKNKNYTVITINDATPIEVSRYKNSYDTLYCRLAPTDALDIGNVLVTVGPVIDACGYKTVACTKEISVIAIPPEVISLIQSKNSTESETILDIVFTDEMKLLSGNISEYFEFFKIVAGIKEIIYPTITVKTQTEMNGQTTLVVSVKDPILYPGYVYEVNVSGMENIYGTEMIPYAKILHIKDMSAPSIKAIYLTDHTTATLNHFDADTEGYKVAIIFNEPMATEGIHSLTYCDNYAIILGEHIDNDPCDEILFNDKDTRVKVVLNHENCIDIVALKESTISRICLNKEFFTKDAANRPLTFDERNLVVKAGHCDLKEIKYLTNTSENVLNFVCPIEEDMSLKVNLATATTNIISNETLVINYSAQNNELLNIDASAFSVKAIADIEATIAIDAKVVSPTELIITFPNDTFVNPDKKLYIEASGEDLFGNHMMPVTAKDLVYNSIPMLTKAYKYHRHGDIVIFGLEFNEPVRVLESAHIAAKDYSISINGGPAKAGTLFGRLVNPEHLDNTQVENVFGASKTLFLQLTNYNNEVFLPTDKFTISVNSEQGDFGTVDYENNIPVEIFENVDANTPYPQVGAIVGDYNLTGTNLAINYKSSIGAKLDEYTSIISADPNSAPINFIPVNISKAANLADDYWEIKYKAEPLFNSFSIVVKGTASTEPSAISLPSPVITYVAGIYTLAFTLENTTGGISENITKNTLANIDIGVSNAFTTILGVPTANNSVHCIPVLPIP
ncbi:MAG: hypothetical protein ACRCWG_12905 [Sarcina sp.]